MDIDTTAGDIGYISIYLLQEHAGDFKNGDIQTYLSQRCDKQSNPYFFAKNSLEELPRLEGQCQCEIYE